MKTRALAALFEVLSRFHRDPASAGQLRSLAREVRALERPPPSPPGARGPQPPAASR